MTKYEDLIYGGIHTEEEALEIATERVDNDDIWDAITLDHSTWEVVRVLEEYSTDLFWEALEIAKQKYVEEFFNKVEDEEDDD